MKKSHFSGAEIHWKLTRIEKKISRFNQALENVEYLGLAKEILTEELEKLKEEHKKLSDRMYSVSPHPWNWSMGINFEKEELPSEEQSPKKDSN